MKNEKQKKNLKFNLEKKISRLSTISCLKPKTKPKSLNFTTTELRAGYE